LERDPLGNLASNKKIIFDLKEIECGVVDWTQLTEDRSTGSCEHSYESLGSMKVGQLPNQLSNYPLLKKDPAAWS
jgi:hypothetical protein